MKRIYLREEVYMGCGLCWAHCKTTHYRSKGLVKALKREKPRPLLLSLNSDAGGKEG